MLNEDDLVKEFARIHVLLFKTLSRNGVVYEDYLNLDHIIVNEDKLKTYKNVMSYYKTINKNEDIDKMISSLELIYKPIEDLRFNIIDKNLNIREYRLNAIFYKEIVNIIRCDISIRIAAKLTGITETTIKQACQQERLLNTYKISKNWIVNLKEVQEYWNCKYKDNI